MNRVNFVFHTFSENHLFNRAFEIHRYKLKHDGFIILKVPVVFLLSPFVLGDSGCVPGMALITPGLWGGAWGAGDGGRF